MNIFGISEPSYNLILKTLSGFEEVNAASVFGSRAKGNFKTGSDIDLVLFGENLSDELVSKLSVRLNEELPIPYFVDVVNFKTLNHEELKNHINRISKPFYTKSKLIN